MPIIYKFDTVGTGVSFSAGGRTYGPPSAQVNIELDENGDEVTVKPITSGLFPKILMKASSSAIQVNTVAFSGSGLQLYQQLRALFPSANSGSGGSGTVTQGGSTYHMLTDAEYAKLQAILNVDNTPQ